MVARVMAAAAMMVLPGLGGQWLDRRLGTGWLALLGFACGISVSIYYLIVITRPDMNSGDAGPREKDSVRGNDLK